MLTIAETVTNSDASSNFVPLLGEIGDDPSIMFQDRKCKLRLLVQREMKIWQVADTNSSSLVQCTIHMGDHAAWPALCSEVLLWLACAGYDKEALQKAKRIILTW